MSHFLRLAHTRPSALRRVPGMGGGTSEFPAGNLDEEKVQRRAIAVLYGAF